MDTPVITIEPSKKKKIIGRILLVVAVAAWIIYLASFFRIVRFQGKYFLVSSAIWDSTWRTMTSMTLHTNQGDIFLPKGSWFSFGGANSEMIMYEVYKIGLTEKGVRHNLVYEGNHLGDNIYSIFINSDIGEIIGFDTYTDKPQEFVIDGVTLFVIEELYDVFTVVDYPPFTLADGTVLSPGTKDVRVTLSLWNTRDQETREMLTWKLSFPKWRRVYFIAENPAWEEPLYLNGIVFEKHFGKVVEYNIVENPLN
jgi:hypothetical protein